MTVSLIQGNARTLPLADNTVDLVCTSPPYFALRSYQDGGSHYSGQLGSEPTPAEFVDALIEVTRECVRVMKPSGSLWVNLGDKYAGGNNGAHGGVVAASDLGRSMAQANDGRGMYSSYPSSRWGGIPTKSLIGIPWRYALRCIDDLGLILRAEVIWSKPNGLPESVTDRVRRSHEQWFHFTLEPRYYSAVDEIREAAADSNASRARAVRDWDGAPARVVAGYGGRDEARYGGADGVGAMFAPNPLGKLPGSVWTIPTEPLIVPPELGVDHFAAFPTEWPRRIIAGWSPAGVCTACGEGRRPVVDKTLGPMIGSGHTRPANTNGRRTIARESVANARPSGRVVGAETATITGYACACPDTTAPTTPGVVLDPFGGTGTTALVADVLGRHGISVDMSGDYTRLARWRTTDPGQRAKAARVEKPPAETAGQLGFDFEVTA